MLRAGTIWINNWHMVDPNLPFGGYKQSGVGRELGPDALNEYTEAKRRRHLDLTQSAGSPHLRLSCSPSCRRPEPRLAMTNEDLPAAAR